MSIKPRAAALKWEEEPFHFTCDLSSTKPAQVTVISRECLACSLSLKGEWMHIPFSLSTVHVFRRLPKELVSVLPDCHSLVPGATKSKGGYWLLENLKWCRGCHGSVKWGKGTQLTAFSVGRREKSRAYVPGFRFLGEVAQRTGFYLSWLEACEPACFGCQGATENKGMKTGLQLQHLKE